MTEEIIEKFYKDIIIDKLEIYKGYARFREKTWLIFDDLFRPVTMLEEKQFIINFNAIEIDKREFFKELHILDMIKDSLFDIDLDSMFTIE